MIPLFRVSCKEMLILQRHVHSFSHYQFPEAFQTDTATQHPPEGRKERNVSALLLLVSLSHWWRFTPWGANSPHLWVVSCGPSIADQETVHLSQWKAVDHLRVVQLNLWAMRTRQARALQSLTTQGAPSPRWHQNTPAPSCCALPLGRGGGGISGTEQEWDSDF